MAPAASYAIGLGFALVVPEFFIGGIMRDIWIRVLDHNSIPRGEVEKDIAFLAQLIGLLERLLYIGSVLAGAREFIGVWLAMKVAGGWKGWSKGRDYSWGDPARPQTGVVPGRQEFNVFLLGSGLSLLFAVAGAATIPWLQRGQWTPAIVVDVGLVLAVGILRVWSRPSKVVHTKRSPS